MSRISSYPQVSQLNGTELVLIDAGNPKQTATITTANLSANILSNNLVQTLPAFNATKSAVQSVSAGVTADILFDVVNFQQGSGFNSGTGIFTAPAPGLYRFDCMVTAFYPGSSTTGEAWISKNNGTLATANGTAFFFFGDTLPRTSGASVTLQLSINDTVRVKILNTGSNTLNVQGQNPNPFCWFSCLAW